MPRYELSQRRKAEKDVQRRWELPAGSHVWCYLRHSPGDNQTIDSQRSGMAEWCASNAWLVDRTFVDEAIEGSREDRDQFQLMLSLARQEPRSVDGIVLWSFSRFARDQLDAQLYKAELRKRGYAVLSKIDDIPNNEMAPIYEAFIDWKNQRFLDDLSADVRRGLNYIVEQGYWPGGRPPVGYKAQPEVIGQRHNGEPRMGSRLVKDEGVAARVRLGWEMKLERNASYEEIHEATRLYSNRQHYSDFFDNLLYAGVFVYHGKRYPEGWENGETFCEPYITLDEYLQVQANRQKRAIQSVGASPRSLGSSVLLSGLVVCGQCLAKGKRVTVTSRVDKRRPDTSWYICGVKLRQRGQDCDLPRVATWLLEETVVEALASSILTPGYLRQALLDAQQQVEERRPGLDVEIGALEREAVERESAVRGLLQLIQKQGLSPLLEDEYQRANQAWSVITARLANLRQEAGRLAAPALTEEEIQTYIADLQRVLRVGDVEDRQEVLRRFIRSIVLYPNYVEIEYNFGPSTLAPLGVPESLTALCVVPPGVRDTKTPIRQSDAMPMDSEVGAQFVVEAILNGYAVQVQDHALDELAQERLTVLDWPVQENSTYLVRVAFDVCWLVLPLTLLGHRCTQAGELSRERQVTRICSVVLLLDKVIHALLLDDRQQAHEALLLLMDIRLQRSDPCRDIAHRRFQ